MGRLHLIWLILIAVTLCMLDAWISPAYAQTIIVACPGAWGDNGGSSSKVCSGCSGPIWTSPDANDLVKSDADRSRWPRLGTLKLTDTLAVGPAGKVEGSAASCAELVGAKTVADVLGIDTAPAPPTDPTPVLGSGSITLNWGVPTANTDGTPLTNLTGYRIEWGLASSTTRASTVVSGASALTYAFTGLASGTYSFRIYSQAGTTEGPPSNSVTSDLVAISVPIDCVVSAWSEWTVGAYDACFNGAQSRLDTRSRSIITPPTNGGVNCPALTDVRTVTQSCAIPKKWVVALNGTAATRPAIEPVLPLTGTGLVRGNQDGTIAVGKPCSATEVFKSGGSSYHAVANSDVTLASPTYATREHVAVCVQQ